MKHLQCVAPTGDICGEAVTYSAAENCLYWCDINRFLIHRLCLHEYSVRSFEFDQAVVALSLTTQPGRLLVALARRLVFFDVASGNCLPCGVELDDERVRFNDGRTDPFGHFWVGTMGNNVGPNGENLPVSAGLGCLYKYTHGAELEEFERGIGIANTLCWSPDRTTFYFGDTLKNELRAYPYDASTATISPGKPFFSGYDRGLPDGSAMDAEGYLWNCRFFGGCIVRLAPDGHVDRVVDMPVKNITTCCFGGDDLSVLYITTASVEKASSDRLAGSLFALQTDTRGLPENYFKIRRTTYE